MTPFMRVLRMLLALVAAAAARAESIQGSGDELRMAIVVSRHGIRAPFVLKKSDPPLSAFASGPWPSWEVEPGILTPHGARVMAAMGAFYRDIFAEQGLLTGRPETDLRRVYFRADSDERTIETARSIAQSLLGSAIPAIHARPLERLDPLFRPAAVPVGRPDRALAMAAALGRMGGDPMTLREAIRPQLALLQRVLFGGDATPPGKVSLFDLPLQVRSPGGDTMVVVDGPLHKAEYLAEYFILAYEDGKPLSEVGWGRVDRATLTELMRLHACDWDLGNRTFYVAQVQGSNLAYHLLQTLEQGASGREQPGAIGGLGRRLVFVVGHDTNIANLGGLLGLSWRISGSQENPVLPGGALVFELWRRRSTGALYARIFYVAPTLDEARFGEALSPAHPPAVAPIFIPGCSEAGPGFEAPFSKVEALFRRVIDPQFVLPSAD